MFGLGAPELIIILILALLIFGPNKLPELASSLGKTIKEFKASTQEFTENVVNPTLAPIKEAKQELERDVINPLKEGLDFKEELKDINENVLNPLKETVSDLDPSKSINNIKQELRSPLQDTGAAADTDMLPDIPVKPLTAEEQAAAKEAAEAQLKEALSTLPDDFIS